MQFGLNKPTIPVNKTKRKPFVKANSKKEQTLKQNKKADKKEDKLDKVPLSKSKTFKGKANTRMNNSEKVSPIREKEDISIKQEVKSKQIVPAAKKQVSYNSKMPNEGKQSKAAARYMPPKEKIILHLDDEVEEAPKSKSTLQPKNASTTRVSKLPEFLQKGTRTSFGILSQKNEMDQIKSNNKNEAVTTRHKELKGVRNIISSSIPNFSDVRKSLEPQMVQSFRENVEIKESSSRRENIMNRKRNNLDDLKITPLNERKSVTRQMRMKTLTRANENEPGLIDEVVNYSKPKPEPTPIPIMNNLANSNLNDESMEVGEKYLLDTYAFFSRIMAGALERLGGDESLQLACIEEMKKIVKQKYSCSNKDAINSKLANAKNKSGIPRIDTLKLRKAITKPLDQKSAEEEYQLLTAEIENEYNDILLS